MAQCCVAMRATERAPRAVSVHRIFLHSDAGTSSRGGALLAVKMMSTGDEEG